MTDLTDLTLAEQAELLRRGKSSSREIVDAHLARIEKLDGKLHAFVDVYAEEARALADAADVQRKAHLPLGPLHGLPIALKDLCDIGVLREVKAGREKLFIHPNLMKLLTAEDHKVPEYRV